MNRCSFASTCRYWRIVRLQSSVVFEKESTIYIKAGIPLTSSPTHSAFRTVTTDLTFSESDVAEGNTQQVHNSASISNNSYCSELILAFRSSHTCDSPRRRPVPLTRCQERPHCPKLNDDYCEHFALRNHIPGPRIFWNLHLNAQCHSKTRRPTRPAPSPRHHANVSPKHTRDPRGIFKPSPHI